MSNTYKYLARTVDGREQTGNIQARDENHAAAILAEQNLIPTRIKMQSRSTAGIFGIFRSRLSEDLIIFTRNFSTLFRAGVPLLRALSIIKVGDAESALNRSLIKITEKVRSGSSLSDAMAEHPRVFPKIYSSAVAAGEQTGKMDEVLESLGFMLEKDLELTRQIKAAIRYPIAVVSAIVLAFIVLFTFVIPRFMAFYNKMGSELPLPTRILIGINDLFTGYWIVIVALVAALIFTLKTIYAKPQGRLYIDTKILHTPIFGDLIIKGNVSRFSYIFQILTKSGIPVVKGLEMLAEVVKNSRIAREIQIMAASFRGGRELDTLIDKMTYFPEMAIQMIKVGLESGSLDRMLKEIAKHYGKEVDYKSRQLTSLLEPILTVVLGAFILVVALAIFLPMWNLIQLYRG
jgi:type II secretory pathway component PulF